jgi:hypothetical protein
LDETNDRISGIFDKRDREKIPENSEDSDSKPNWMKRFANEIMDKANVCWSGS